MCAVGAPDFQAALQRPEQSIRIVAGLFGLQLLEQFTRRPPRFGLKPRLQLRRHRHQRIGPAPTTFRLWFGAHGRAYLTRFPGSPQSREEHVERGGGGIVGRNPVRRVGDFDQAQLRSPHVTKQAYGI